MRGKKGEEEMGTKQRRVVVSARKMPTSVNIDVHPRRKSGLHSNLLSPFQEVPNSCMTTLAPGTKVGLANAATANNHSHFQIPSPLKSRSKVPRTPKQAFVNQGGRARP